MSKIELSLNQVGHKSAVVLDGVDISSQLTGVDVSAGVGSVTEVTLHAACVEVTAIGEAVPQWMVPSIIRDALDAAAAVVRNPHDGIAHDALTEKLAAVGWR